MSLDDRSKRILDKLVSNPSITSMDLEKKYDLTRRQLGYSFNKINEWLMTKNLPVIERTRRGHFIIEQSVFTKLNGEEESPALDKTVLSENQRVYLIIMMLLSSEEELSLNHFTIELDVSKNTILSDMKRVKNELNDYDLTIQYTRKAGYLLEGNEFQIRKLLIHVTYQLLQVHSGQNKIKELANIEKKQLHEFNQRIEKVESKLNLKFTDEKLATMPYILILNLRRIEQGNEINSFSIEYEELSDTKEYQATEEIFHDSRQIPVEERLFITLHLLTTNVYWSEYLTDDDAIPRLVPAIDNMLRLFEKSACIYLQGREQLMNKLLQHIKPAYYRIKYQLTETMDMQDSLNKEFKELHHLVKRSTGPLKDLIGSDIPESETTYITMLIGGWMTKQGDSIEKKIKAIVVCPQGVSVSRLMFTELRELFPGFVFLDSLSVREFLDYGLDYDIVFSPTSLETDKKLFISNAFLGHEEKYRLRKQVMLELHGYIPRDINVDHLIDIIRNNAVIKDEKTLTEDLQKYIDRDEEASVKQPMKTREINLNDLIPANHITIRNSVQSWEEAIHVSAKPLVESGKIEREYVEAMIRRTGEDPYIVIGPNIAIPHAAPEEGVNEVGMSLLRLEEGVNFTKDYRINLVVVIAAVDKQQHIHGLMQLMKLAGSETDRNRVISADSVEEIQKMIALYSVD
ncbi:BglG family transcription antiterminator [Halobacillus shinanisalinarum]|uniref:Ascorbate-specific PTS system EIIA component n=1 Tax=Halobacillus shinanisalinarum TaxID=2932258 RepID=A0ABY4H2Y7_9BACI|nr:BglG family transcription antiterminator [Halobacillus shinanisalinarum]UOQ94684.1 BglG family transcription antiterminator [Halobacillus shinanisalinarum]